MFRLLFFLFIWVVPFFAHAAATEDFHLRDTSSLVVTGPERSSVRDFISPFIGFFADYDGNQNAGVNTFIGVAWAIKDFFVATAFIFLAVGVIRLLFSSGEEEDVKKWRKGIIWVTVGLIVMQIGFNLWKALLYPQNTPDGTLISGDIAWSVWINIFSPLVWLLLLFASFGFLSMAVYAFYLLVSSGGDEEKTKKGKHTIVYAIIGFILIRLPKSLIGLIYGTPQSCSTQSFGFECTIWQKNLSGALAIFGKIFTYVTGFLGIVAVLLIIYAGWLVMISGGDDEKIKKARNIVLYIALGILLLVGSHAIFKFFFLPDL